jgi:hypothetical protein
MSSEFTFLFMPLARAFQQERYPDGFGEGGLTAVKCELMAWAEERHPELVQRLKEAAYSSFCDDIADASLAEGIASGEGENYFGVCPECGKTDGYLNIGRAHWFVCHEHRVRWCAGHNLFSGWREEDEAEWPKNWERIGEYRVP